MRSLPSEERKARRAAKQAESREAENRRRGRKAYLESLPHWDRAAAEKRFELVEQLTELAQAQGHGPTRTPAVAVTNEAQGEEGWDQAVNQVRQVETVRCAVRARARTGVALVSRVSYSKNVV